MAASLTAPKVTWMCPSPLISASQLARDRGKALLAVLLGRLVVAVDLDQAFANRPQGGVELGASWCQRSLRTWKLVAAEPCQVPIKGSRRDCRLLSWD